MTEETPQQDPELSPEQSLENAPAKGQSVVGVDMIPVLEAEKEDASKWPLWVIFGGVVLGLIVIIVIALRGNFSVFGRAGSDSASDNRVHLLTTRPGPDVPPDPNELIIQGLYKVRAPTPVCENAGDDVKGPGVKMLPAHHEIGIISAKTVDGTKWYEVMTATPTSTRIGKGWVSSASLAGQTLLLVGESCGAH